MYVGYRWGVTEDQIGVTVPRYPWPDELAWNSLPAHFDDLQTWLLDQRNAENPNVVFAVFNGFATLVDNLVNWFNRLLLWLTWVGTTVAGTWSRCASAVGAPPPGSAVLSRPSR